MKTLLLFCFLLFNSIVFARQTQWNEGVLVLSGAEVRQGDISVDAFFDMILFKRGDSVMVYPAHRIKSLYFYDSVANINRIFVSLRTRSNTFREYRLYEVVLRGDIGVVRKQKRELLSSENPEKSNYDYFVQMRDELTPLGHFKTKVYPELLKVSHDQILNFIREERVNPNHSADAIRIIKFFNASAKDEIFAKRN